MNKFYKQGLLLALIAITTLLGAVPIFSQGSTDISEGTEYWFGIPHCKKAAQEDARWTDNPIQLWISSRTSTKFTLESADGSLSKSYDITAGQVQKIELPATFMCDGNDIELVTSKGLHIKADAPVSVGVFMGYAWSGEAYRCIPVEWLGYSYYTLNMYQDHVQMVSGEINVNPSQILVVATEDRTEVTYIPKAITLKHAAGSTVTVNLNKGNTYLIEGKELPNMDWTPETDLSGTLVKANKPIAVYSGHTKGAYPNYPIKLYHNMLRADFIRNMLMEQMWPVQVLGKEYVTAPFKYPIRVYADAVANERGDLLRFVASADNTTIWEKKYDSKKRKTFRDTLATLVHAGDYFDIPAREKAGLFQGDSAFMLGQYGKAWISDFPKTKGDEGKVGDGETQNPTLNGQGMLITIAPLSRWCTYSAFECIQGMYAFVYLTFKMADADKLFFDQSSFLTYFGNEIIPIADGVYGYVTKSVSAGSHVIESNDPAARFAGYAYGNFDSHKDGFAYGYPIGINYATPCDDSLVYKDKMECGVITGECKVVAKGVDTTCLGMYRVKLLEQDTNNVDYTLLTKITSETKLVQYMFKVRDIRKPASAAIEFRTVSGRIGSRSFTYTPENMAFDSTSLFFGVLNPNEKDTCISFVLRNTGSKEVIIKDLKQLVKDGNFRITSGVLSFPFTLAVGDSMVYTVCCNPLHESANVISDTIRIYNSCDSTDIALNVMTGAPRLTVGDKPFGSVVVGTTKNGYFTVSNTGAYEVVIDDIQRIANFKPEFVIGSYNKPIRLAPGTSQNIPLSFTPSSTATFLDTANAIANAKEDKLYSAWSGNGINANVTISDKDWGKQRVHDSYSNAPYPGSVVLKVNGNNQILIDKIAIVPTYVGTPEGVFSLVDSIRYIRSVEAGDSLIVDLLFDPLLDTYYNAKIEVTAHFQVGQDRVDLTASGDLTGAGTVPHINGTSYTFFPLIVGNSDTTNTKYTSNTLSFVSGKFEAGNSSSGLDLQLPLVVKNVTLSGLQANYFNLTNGEELRNDTVPLGSKRYPNVVFKPTVAGKFVDSVLIDCDVDTNYVTNLNEKRYLIIEGTAFDTNTVVTHTLFPKIFRNTSTNLDLNGNPAEVSFSNTKPNSVQMDKLTIIGIKIDPVNPGDEQQFIFDQALVETYKSKPLLKDEKITIPFTYAPKAEGTHRLVVTYTYKYSLEPDATRHIQTSYVEGSADYIAGKLLVKDYGFSFSNPIAPNEVKTMVVKYDKDNSVATDKSIKDAKIYSLNVKINYDQNNDKLATDANTRAFKPDPNSINTNGSPLAGWKMEINSESMKSNALEVKFTQSDKNKPLEINGNDVLFYYNIKAFLTPTKNQSDVAQATFTPELTIEKAVDFVQDFDPNGYLVNTTEGDRAQLSKVCSDELRAVVSSNIPTALYDVNQNPASAFVNIEYSVSFDDTYTTIILYNSNGEVVARLYDGIQSSGPHNIPLNLDQTGIPSGTYYCRMISGIYTATKQFSVVK